MRPGIVRLRLHPSPEDTSFVEAFHAELRRNPGPTLERARAARETWTKRGVDLLPWSGWPLRPFFFSHRKMQSLCRQLLGRMELFTQELAKSDASQISERLGLPQDFLERISLREAFQDPSFLKLMRPDGFLHEDSFVVGEINFGNGLIVSNAYTEILADYHRGEPILEKLGQEVLRPFQAYLDLLGDLLPTKPREERPLIGLLSFSWEYQVICSWEKRVRDQLQVARSRMTERGWDSVIIHEDEVELVNGAPFHHPSGRYLDLVAHVTINTSFMDEPHRMDEDYAIWSGHRLGEVPLYKPLAALCFDKGTLTWLQDFPEPACEDYSVPLARTEFPQAERAAEYRLEREKWVLKRSFDGKDTHVGRSAAGRAWNRTLQKVLGGKDYIMQEYEVMPRTLMPITQDGESIDWVEVCFEFSPFLINREFAGAAVRYAPAAEGLIMSPPPEGMGFGIVSVV